MIGLILALAVASTQKLCLPTNTTVPYSTACPAGTTSTRKICPDGTQVAYSAPCPATKPEPTPDPTPTPKPQPTRKLCLPSSTIVGYTAACPAGTTSTRKICPYGQQVPYSTACPTTADPPPPSGVWVEGPVVLGGYACNGVQAGKGNVPPCGKGIVIKIVGTVPNSSAAPNGSYPAGAIIYVGQFFSDASGQFPIDSQYETTVLSYWSLPDLTGLKPAP